MSMGSGMPCGRSTSCSDTTPCATVSVLPGGVTTASLGERRPPSVASRTGIIACRRSSSGKKLTACGSMWLTTIKATPESAGTWAKKASMASKPPAEAPMPTTGKPTSVVGASARDAADGAEACAEGAAFLARLRDGRLGAAIVIDFLYRPYRYHSFSPFVQDAFYRPSYCETRF
jgi:hypothetical protein